MYLSGTKTSFPVALAMCVFLELDDDKCNVQVFSGNHALRPIRIVLVVALQNVLHQFLLEDHCVVLLLLRCLAKFGWMVRDHNLLLTTEKKP